MMRLNRAVLVATALASVVFVACTSSADDEPGFADWVGSWVLTSGIETIDAWPATLEISNDLAWGNLCNSFELSISTDGFVAGAGTALSCGPDVDALELVFMRAVEGATPEVVDGQLVLTGPDSELTFTRQEAAPTEDQTPVDWSANSPYELECESEMREYATFDSGDNTALPATIEGALDEWESSWHPSQQVLNRGAVADQVAAAVAAYFGSEGKTRFVVRLQHFEQGWGLASYEACSPPW